jgi:hypothetical protein
VATYPFEVPGTFLTDFAVAAVFGDSTVQAILSEPGEDLMGGKIASNQYEAEYLTSSLPALIYGNMITFSSGTTVTIPTVALKVLTSYPIDDGTFSRVKLES